MGGRRRRGNGRNVPPDPQAADGAPKRRKVTVALDASRILARTKEHVDVLDHIDQVEAALKKHVDDTKATIKTLKARAAQLRAELRTGTEDAEVDVVEEMDWDRRTVNICRSDLPKNDPARIIDRRNMTEGELQMGLTMPPAEVSPTLAAIAKAADDATSKAIKDAGGEDEPAADPPPADPKVPPRRPESHP